MCLIDTFETHRPLLFATAYRMLGSATEAEDIVQETYLRFQAAAAQDIRSPRAYLCTIVTRLCLDALSAARTTHERYLGPWLREPLLTEGDDLPLQTAIQRESISLAVLILLERLTPQERTVFVLHEVFEYPHSEIAAMIGLSAANCRQLFHRAQQHLAAERVRFTPTPEAHQRMVDQLLAAMQQGDLPALTALFADDVRSWSDGGVVSAAGRPVYGSQQVARLVMGGAGTFPPGVRAERTEINGQPALQVWAGDTLVNVTAYHMADDRIRAIYLILNPEKLTFIQRQWASSSLPVASGTDQQSRLRNMSNC